MLPFYCLLISHTLLHLFSYETGIGAVSDNPLADSINIDQVYVEAVNGILNHPVHPFILLRFPEADMPEPTDDGDGEIPEDLMIQVFPQQQGIILITFYQNIPGILGDYH